MLLAEERSALPPGGELHVPWRLDRRGATRPHTLAYYIHLRGPRVRAHHGDPLRMTWAVEIAAEAAQHGFVVGAWDDGVLLVRDDAEASLVSVRASVTPAHAAAHAILAARVSRALVRAETRRALSPRDAIAGARDDARHAPTRDAFDRARLGDLVFACDLFYPGGPNCYRRVLAESALDRGAAGEEVVLGLDPASSGHAWLEPRDARIPRESLASWPVTNRL